MARPFVRADRLFFHLGFHIPYLMTASFRMVTSHCDAHTASRQVGSPRLAIFCRSFRYKEQECSAASPPHHQKKKRMRFCHRPVFGSLRRKAWPPFIAYYRTNRRFRWNLYQLPNISSWVPVRRNHAVPSSRIQTASQSPALPTWHSTTRSHSPPCRRCAR